MVGATVRIWGVAVLGLVSAWAWAVPDTNVVLVEAGAHRLLRESLSVIRVAVGDPTVADVNIVNRHELLVTGKQRGVTSLIVWYQKLQQPREYRLVVQPIRNPLEQEAKDPELGQAQLSDGRMTGSLPNLAAHRRARLKAGEEVRDESTIALGTQVLTDIKIAELSRSTLKKFGFNLFVNQLDATVGVSGPGTLSGAALGAPANPGNPIVLDSASGFLPLRDAFNIVLGDATKNVLGFLSLLENQGLVRTLAEPSLVATSGQTASFLAGGEFPVPVSQGNNSGISIEYKEFGVRLLLTPTVLSRDRISLKVAPEVSELDFSVGVQVGGVAVPALTVRRTDTTVELGDGESFVISGLVSRNLLANVDKVPFISSIPILGAFFKSTRYDREEKELIMVVTPHLVRPLKRGFQMPDLPGAQYDNYNPSAGQLLFQESGGFRSGLSK